MMSWASLRPAAVSVVTLGCGVTLALTPAATVSIASHLYPAAEQGAIAVMVMVSAFVGQLAFASIVEARLSSVETRRHVAFPRWLGGLAILASLAVAISGSNVVVLCLALPPMLAALEVARGVSVAERLDHREWAAAAAVGLGAATGVLAGFFEQAWAFAPLAGGILVATAVRLQPVPHQVEPPSRHAVRWVVADTAVTGVIYPLLNGVILALLGPEDAVRFVAISTVSGSLAVPINFLRFRLLKEHSLLDVVVVAGTMLVAVAALLTAESLGLFSLLFGKAWSHDTVLFALIIACLWRSGSLATTLPFAALRRAGQVRALTILRAAVSVGTFVAALGGLYTGTLSAVFIGLLIAELLSALVYEAARRRLPPGSSGPPRLHFGR